MAGAERENLLARSDLDLDIAARLGDKAAERAMIESFTSELDYHKKGALARRLGYIGTERCVVALVDGLKSDVVARGEHEERSVRCAVLLALGQVYQDEQLFTSIAKALVDSSDDVFDLRYGLNKFLVAVDSWVTARFGRGAWGDQKVWFVRFHGDLEIVR